MLCNHWAAVAPDSIPAPRILPKATKGTQAGPSQQEGEFRGRRHRQGHSVLMMMRSAQLVSKVCSDLLPCLVPHLTEDIGLGEVTGQEPRKVTG